MKSIFKYFPLLLLVACNTPQETTSSLLEPFIRKAFPKANFEVVVQNNIHKLIINDQGPVAQEFNMDSLMTETLGNFYLSFYQSSPNVAANSELMISYSAKDLVWESEAYNLFELGEMYSLVKE